MAAYNIPGSSTSMPKSGLPVTIAWVSTPGLRVADDAVILGVFELDAARARARAARRLWRQARHNPRSAPRRREAPGRIAWCIQPAGTPQVCAAAVISNWRPAAPTRRIGSQPCRRVRGASGKLPAVDLLVQFGLLDANILPVDIQFLGNQHGQHVAHALAGLRGARHDGDHAIRSNVDEGLWRQVRRLLLAPGPAASGER